MSVETELAQAVRMLDVISNELGSLNRNIEKYLKSIAPPEPTCLPNLPVLCTACLDEIDLKGFYHHCKHQDHCLPCGPCMECGDGEATA